MKNTLPVLLLKKLILLPNQEVKLELNNDLSKDVINLSIEEFNNEVIVLPIKDQLEETPDVGDLPKIAVIAKIKASILLPNGNLRVTLRGLFRGYVEKLTNDSAKIDILKCRYEKIKLAPINKIESSALEKKLKELLEKYISFGGNSNSILNVLKDIKDLNKYTDLVASFLPLSFARKLEYIECVDATGRASNLLDDLLFEIEVLKLDQKLEERLQNNLEDSQKEYILKEKLKEIEAELGNEKDINIKKYYENLDNLDLNEKTYNKIKNEITKLEYMSDVSPELASIRNYLDTFFALPWNKASIDEENLTLIKRNLDETHYGMQDAKDKILEYIAAKKRSEDIDTPILCLVGPSGVGKTTLAKSISRALNKSFYKISVGGLNDSSILNGHRRTYLGSAPGKIIEGIKKCGVKNPVILIDEVDKMVHDYKGDPASTLLEILDKNQNSHFVDNYLEEEFDLSQVLFILTANNLFDIPSPLRDRLEIINLSSYTVLEKTVIGEKYLLPKIYNQHKVNSKNIKFTESAIKELVLKYTNESGVRELERVLTSIIRKLIVLDSLDSVKITSEEIKKLLGNPKYLEYSLTKQNVIGVVNALAVSNARGFILPIEVCMYKGTGKILMTGFLDKTMEESIRVSLSYILNNSKYYEIESNLFNEFDLHIHFLASGIEKSGTSAGVTITTAILSLLKKKIIPKKIAMTGEISLNGFVSPIGSLKEKIIGAYNEGIKEVFIPESNHFDLEEISSEILTKIEIIEVSKYEEIYEKLFKGE